jgi:hypothetical protein
VPKYTLIETHDPHGRPSAWALIELPDRFREGDPLPAPHELDRFRSKEAAILELSRRIVVPRRQ